MDDIEMDNIDIIFGGKQVNFDYSEKIRKEKEEWEKLKERSKKIHELVFQESFVVLEVLSTSEAITFTPDSEMVMGGRSPVYDGGHTSCLELKVEPVEKDIPVRSLTFRGNSPVMAGDRISARIPRYKREKVDLFGSYEKEDEIYDDRPYNEREDAIELNLYMNGRVVRTDRSVEYDGIMAK